MASGKRIRAAIEAHVGAEVSIARHFRGVAGVTGPFIPIRVTNAPNYPARGSTAGFAPLDLQLG
jgi:hypothetical protein